MSQREKRHQRRLKYFDEHKLDDNDNQINDAHVQIGPDDIDSSVPQKVTKIARKRKSISYHDSKQSSDDDDYSPKKSKYKEALMMILNQSVRKTNLPRWVQSQERGFPLQQVHIMLDLGMLLLQIFKRQ